VVALLSRFIVMRFAPDAPHVGHIAAAALVALGIGAINEIAEFGAAIGFDHTYVGNYYNTGLDLIANAVGAIAAIVAAEIYDRLKTER
jgi:hypothetical protein